MNSNVQHGVLCHRLQYDRGEALIFVFEYFLK